MRRQNRKARRQSDSPASGETKGFQGYLVSVKGVGCLSILAGSMEAAERVARSILGGAVQPYTGPMEIRQEALLAPRGRRRP